MRAFMLLIAAALILVGDSELEAQVRYGHGSGWVPYGSYYSAFGNSYGMDRHPNYARQRALPQQATRRPESAVRTQPQADQLPTPRDPNRSTDPPAQPMPPQQATPDIQPGRDPARTPDPATPAVPGNQQVPLATASVQEMFRQRPNLSRFAAAADLAGLLQQVPADGQITVFVPRNESIDTTPEDWRRLVLDPAKLREGMKRYALPQAVTMEQALASGAMKSLGGEELRFRKVGDDMTVNGIKVIEANIRCTDGLIHVIERLLPTPEANQN